METAFWYKLALSFIVGGAWITLSSIAAEKFGSKVGGLIGGLPSTVLVSLLFIGVTQSPSMASEATTIIPFSQALNGFVVIVYILLVGRGWGRALLGAVFVWFVFAGVLITIGVQSFWISVVGWMLILPSCFMLVEKWMRIPSQAKVRVRYSAPQIVYRALFGGSVIAAAVLLGKIGGPNYGGVFATFPALFLSTLVVTYQTGGTQFSRAVAKSIMMSGLINVPLYAIAVRYLYPWLGLAIGTMVAVIFSIGTVYLTFLFFKMRLS